MTDYPQYPIRPASLQEAFDTAALHVLSTGRPSIGESGCVYSGIGCAMRPFIPQDEDSLRWMDQQGELQEILDDEEWDKYLPQFVVDDLEFFIELQTAHDAYAIEMNRGHKSVEFWLSQWKTAMQSIAARYSLDASLITDQTALAQ